MKKEIEIIPPSMPNYVQFVGLEKNNFDIIKFTKEEAEEFAELMKNEFLKHYEHRKGVIACSIP